MTSIFYCFETNDSILIAVLRLHQPEAQLESFVLHCRDRDDDDLNNYINESLYLSTAY